MKTHFDITYEVIDPITHERFVTEDRYIAEHHYSEKSCTVYERHTTITQFTRFSEEQSYAILLWHDDDENINPELEDI